MNENDQPLAMLTREQNRAIELLIAQNTRIGHLFNELKALILDGRDRPASRVGSLAFTKIEEAEMWYERHFIERFNAPDPPPTPQA